MLNQNSNSFYDAITKEANELMAKEASYDEKSIETALSESDLSEEEISKLAAAIEDMIEDDSDDDIVVDDAETEDVDGAETENVDDAETEDVDDADGADGAEVVDGEGEAEVDDDAETEDVDIEQLAAYYDEVQEKYASAGLGVADYVYNQFGCPDDAEAIHLAKTIEETAEKLAYVADVSPYVVADDLLNAMAAKLEGEDEE